MTSLKEQIARYKNAPEKEPRISTSIWFELPVNSSLNFEFLPIMDLNNALRGESTEEERLAMCSETLEIWRRNNTMDDKRNGEEIFGNWHGIYGGEVIGLRSGNGEVLEVYHGVPSQINGSGQGPIACSKRLCIIRGTTEDIRRYEAAIFGEGRFSIPLLHNNELVAQLIFRPNFCEVSDDDKPATSFADVSGQLA